MQSKTYDKLSDFDKRLADCPGTVYTFDDIQSWKSFCKTCDPKALTNREKLAVVVVNN